MLWISSDLGGRSAGAARGRAWSACAPSVKRLQEAACRTGERVPTLSDFAERFLEHQQTINRPSEMGLKRQILRDHVLPAFGHLRLDHVTDRRAWSYVLGRPTIYEVIAAWSASAGEANARRFVGSLKVGRSRARPLVSRAMPWRIGGAPGWSGYRPSSLLTAVSRAG